MRKTTTLLLMVTFGFHLMAQTGFSPAKLSLDRLQKNDVIHNQNSVRSSGEVIWSEDFDGADWSATSNNGEPVPENAPAGWGLGDLTDSGYYWRWDTVGPRGEWTSAGDDCHVPRGKLGSTTGANGFMMLEADYFNSMADCSWYFNNGMDSYIEYNAGIDFSSESVIHLIFEQANRFCCSYSADYDAWFMVSTDNGTTWTNLKVSEGEINTGIGDLDDEIPFISEYDISSDVAGESNVWFRFHLNGLSHYHWEIDDVAFVVPPNNEIRFLDYWNDYITYMDGSDDNTTIQNSYDFTEGFYEYPWFLVQEYKGFHAAYINFGGVTQTNFVHNVEIWKNGSLQELIVSDPIDSLPVGVQDTTMLEATVWPWQKGEYTFVHYPSMDEIDDEPSNDTLRRYMKVGNSIVRVVDFEKVNSYIYRHNVTSDGGDGLGFILNLPDPSLHDQDGQEDFYKFLGVEVYIASHSEEELDLFINGEAKLHAAIYKYDSANDTYIEQIASDIYTLSVEDTSSIVYVPFAADESVYCFEGGEFIVGVQMYGTYNYGMEPDDSWKIMSVSNTVQKNSMESCVEIGLNSNSGSLDFVNKIGGGLAIALDIEYSETCPLDLQDLGKLDVSIYPNPSPGIFTIELDGTYEVQIIDVSGKVVHETRVNEQAQIEIPNATKGIYFIKCRKDNYTITKTIIVE